MSSAPLSDHLASQIRERIAAGEYAPGDRLPTFQQIESQFQVGRSVTQLATNRLREEGFIRPGPGRGLYVTQDPPHLSRFGIVLPPLLGGQSAMKSLEDALVLSARHLEGALPARQFTVFGGGAELHGGNSVREQLCEMANSDHLAGAILTFGTHDLADLEPFASGRLPKVMLFAWEGHGRTPCVTVDSEALFGRALRSLAERGRRRVAMVRMSDYATYYDWQDIYEKAGVEYRPQWVQPVGRCDPSVVQALIPLMLDYPEGERPDALFIADDHLVEPAVTAVAQMGLQIGKDIDIVAHCNWPSRTPCMLPMRRIGFHTGRMLEGCLEAISAQRRGEEPEATRVIPPLFEEELQPDG